MSQATQNRTFCLGTLAIHCNALRVLNLDDVRAAVRRHAHCDWGECCPEDAAENDFAVDKGFRLLSVYRDRSQTVFWIITEADRSATTVLLPEDY
jgi:hypothetical protein